MGSLDVRGKARSVSGKIDRLAVTDDEVLIVDYKTNRPPPTSSHEVPPAYVAAACALSRAACSRSIRARWSRRHCCSPRRRG